MKLAKITVDATSSAPIAATTTRRRTRCGASTAAAPMNSGKTTMKRGRPYSGRAVVEHSSGKSRAAMA